MPRLMACVKWPSFPHDRGLIVQVRVQEAPFDPGAELNAFSAEVQGAGAIVSFSGVTRDLPGGMRHMEIEHYPGMTERALSDIRQEAMTRFDLAGAWSSIGTGGWHRMK